MSVRNDRTPRTRHRAAFAGLMLAVIGLICLAERHSTHRVCYNCGKLEWDDRAALSWGAARFATLPFRIGGGPASAGRSLVDLLDPQRQCRHSWRTIGGASASVIDGTSSAPRDPGGSWVLGLPDFDDFVAADPSVVEETRRQLRRSLDERSRLVGPFLEQRYREWEQAQQRRGQSEPRSGGGSPASAPGEARGQTSFGGR